MASIKIAFINASTVVPDPEAQRVMAALQRQVSEHYAKVWGIDADLQFVGKGKNPPAGSWWLVILDNSDEAGALGYHDLTQEGMPLGKIFAGTDKQYGSEWSVTASHELLEMLEDPDINLTVFRLNENDDPMLYAYEVCDACEADKFGYKIDNILVSDFVYPSWFEDFEHPPGTKYDQEGHVKAAFELIEDGYIGVNKLDSCIGWSQLYAKQKDREYKMRPSTGARRERRGALRSSWMRSSPKK